MADMNDKTLRRSYLASFLIALHFGLPLYINSSYLALFIPEAYVGLVFTGASALLILVLVWFRYALERIGNTLVAQWILIAELLALGMLLYGTHATLITLALMIHMIAASLLAFSMDIFLEDASRKSAVGRIRGRYLTASNVGVLCSPLLIGLFLSDSNFSRIYSASVVVLAFLFLVIVRAYGSFRDPRYQHSSFIASWKQLRGRSDVVRICIINFLLYLFYSIMVVYTPLYLVNHIGFSWRTIGWVFTIMLTPFVFMQLPLGRIADKKLGEKELLTAGFSVMAITTGALAFLLSNSVLLWAAALFATRLGASTVEIMTETYFFKKINSADTPALTFFRIMRPIGYVIGPILATAVLLFLPFRFLFLILGILLLSGIYFSLFLKDTR